MSIRDDIKVHLGKELFLLEPLLPAERVIRTMFISKEINRVVHPPWAQGRNGTRHAQMRAWLETFIAGRRIPVAEHPFKKGRDAYLARVHPVANEIWDIRCMNPNPGIRVFGRFTELDTFVALTWEHRESINGKQFDTAIARAMNEWRRLFPTIPVFKGNKINDYLSGNFYAV
jgi:hypothetical protein